MLDDALHVANPEGVQLAAVLADPLSRAQALLLDMLIIAVSLYVLAVLLSLLSAGLASQGIFTALAFVLVWGYFFLFEWLWRGVTPGKRALNLQVISADLMPLSAAQAGVAQCAALSGLVARFFWRGCACFGAQSEESAPWRLDGGHGGHF